MRTDTRRETTDVGKKISGKTYKTVREKGKRGGGGLRQGGREGSEKSRHCASTLCSKRFKKEKVAWLAQKGLGREKNMPVLKRKNFNREH